MAEHSSRMAEHLSHNRLAACSNPGRSTPALAGQLQLFFYPTLVQILLTTNF